MKKAPTIISPVSVKDDLVKRILTAINDNIDTIFGRKVGSSPFVTVQDLIDWRVIVKDKDTYISRQIVEARMPSRSNTNSTFGG